MFVRKNYKKSAPERAGIVACAIGHAKKVAISESHEIAHVDYLGQIMNIESSRARKLFKECSRKGSEISMHDWAREKGCHLRITRNRTSSIFRPYNKNWKRLRSKIIKGAPSGGPGY